MTHLDMTVGSDASHPPPIIRKITTTDLKDALAEGIDDFWAVPTHAIFLSITSCSCSFRSGPASL